MSLLKKRPQPLAKPSQVQEGRVLKLVVLVLALSLLWLIFAPGSGLVTLMGHRAELARLAEETSRLEQRLEGLQQEIDRLQGDPAYLERVARKDFGLLKKNEKVYDFSPPKAEKDQQ